MFFPFRRRSAKPDPSPALVPSGTCVYAIGDIHGSLDALQHLHVLIRQQSERRGAERNVVVYLGDYVDRGLQSKGVLDLLVREPLAGFERVHLKGNHDDWLLRFLTDERVGPAWFEHGGIPTLLSYGVRPPLSTGGIDELKRVQGDLKEKLPPAHLDFLERLMLFHVEGDYLFVHAGLRPGVPFERQDPTDMMWIRDEFLKSNAAFGKVVVHGHDVTATPVVKANRIGIDTGAFANGRLTCLILDGADRRFIET